MTPGASGDEREIINDLKGKQFKIFEVKTIFKKERVDKDNGEYITIQKIGFPFCMLTFHNN